MDNHLHTLDINMEKEADMGCVPTKPLDPTALNKEVEEMEKAGAGHPNSERLVRLNVAK